MKKQLLGLIVIIVIACSIGCKSSSSPEAVLERTYNATNAYISDLTKANDANDVAQAINNYADEMEELMPLFKAIEKDNPQINFKKNQYPPELQEIGNKLKGLTPRLMTVSFGTMKYMRDENVKKAFKRFSDINKKYQ